MELSAPAISRRQLLAGASAAALSVALGGRETIADNGKTNLGEPFDDGTFFDDGAGWIE